MRLRLKSLLPRFLALCLLCGGLSAAQPMAQRVVSQTVGTDEMLLALAEPGQIACLSHLAREPGFSAVAREAADYPVLGYGDSETILKYNPDLVLAGDFSRAELVEQVRRSGVRLVILTRYRTLEDSYASLREIADALGGKAPERAEAIIADCRRRVDELAARLKNVKPVRVIAPSTYGVIPGADTTFADLCAHAGATNLAETLGGLRGDEAPPREQMLTWPIDKVVVQGNDDASAIAPFLKLPPYQFMPVIRERRIARILPYMMSCVSHRRVDAYEMLARALHPEVFE